MSYHGTAGYSVCVSKCSAGITCHYNLNGSLQTTTELYNVDKCQQQKCASRPRLMCPANTYFEVTERHTRQSFLQNQTITILTINIFKMLLGLYTFQVISHESASLVVAGDPMKWKNCMLNRVFRALELIYVINSIILQSPLDLIAWLWPWICDSSFQLDILFQDPGFYVLDFHHAHWSLGNRQCSLCDLKSC